MGVIFPLSIPGKIVLILIAIVLGVICFMLWSEKFRNFVLGKKRVAIAEEKINQKLQDKNAGGKRE